MFWFYVLLAVFTAFLAGADSTKSDGKWFGINATCTAINLAMAFLLYSKVPQS
jgi:hypothetical protein